MVKATLRSAVLLGLLVCSAPGYAEVQNVKVGGGVNVRAIGRNSIKLSEDVFNSAAQVDSATADFGGAGDYFLQQVSRIRVQSDLTENVSAEVAALNERIWGTASDATDTTDEGADQIVISAANLTLKDFFYSPLSLTIGRQPLWYGRGFIVGSRLLQGDTDPGNHLAADEYGGQTNFDAITMKLDLAGAAPAGLPLVIDAVYAKIDENDVSVTGLGDSASDDVNLLGVNIGSKFDSMSGEVEAYYFNKRNNELDDVAPGNGNLDNNPQSNTLGFRGSVAPVEGASVWGELAYQWGNRITSGASYDAEGAPGDDYQAWAANLGADYTAGDVAWSPTLGGEWIFWTGDDGDNTAIGGWEPVYRGRFTSILREWQNIAFYMPAQSGATVQGTFNNLTNSYTNQHQLALHATLRPIEDLSVDNRFTWFISHVGIRPTSTAKREHDLGSEWDVVANYNYTDDVQLGLSYALYSPGSVFRHPYDETAQQLITSVNVAF